MSAHGRTIRRNDNQRSLPFSPRAVQPRAWRRAARLDAFRVRRL